MSGVTHYENPTIVSLDTMNFVKLDVQSGSGSLIACDFLIRNFGIMNGVSIGVDRNSDTVTKSVDDGGILVNSIDSSIFLSDSVDNLNDIVNYNNTFTESHFHANFFNNETNPEQLVRGSIFNILVKYIFSSTDTSKVDFTVSDSRANNIFFYKDSTTHLVADIVNKTESHFSMSSTEEYAYWNLRTGTSGSGQETGTVPFNNGDFMYVYYTLSLGFTMGNSTQLPSATALSNSGSLSTVHHHSLTNSSIPDSNFRFNNLNTEASFVLEWVMYPEPLTNMIFVSASPYQNMTLRAFNSSNNILDPVVKTNEHGYANVHPNWKLNADNILIIKTDNGDGLATEVSYVGDDMVDSSITSNLNGVFEFTENANYNVTPISTIQYHLVDEYTKDQLESTKTRLSAIVDGNIANSHWDYGNDRLMNFTASIQSVALSIHDLTTPDGEEVSSTMDDNVYKGIANFINNTGALDIDLKDYATINEIIDEVAKEKAGGDVDTSSYNTEQNRIKISNFVGRHMDIDTTGTYDEIVTRRVNQKKLQMKLMRSGFRTKDFDDNNISAIESEMESVPIGAISYIETALYEISSTSADVFDDETVIYQELNDPLVRLKTAGTNDNGGRLYDSNGTYRGSVKSYAGGEPFTGEWIQSIDYRNNATAFGIGSDNYIADDSKNIGSVMKMTRFNMWGQPVRVTVLGSDNNDFNDEFGSAVVIIQHYEILREHLVKQAQGTIDGTYYPLEYYKNGTTLDNGTIEDGSAPLYIPMYHQIDKTVTNYKYYRTIFETNGESNTVNMRTIQYVPFVEVSCSANGANVTEGVATEVTINAIALNANITRIYVWGDGVGGFSKGMLYTDQSCITPITEYNLGEFTDGKIPFDATNVTREPATDDGGPWKSTYNVTFWYKPEISPNDRTETFRIMARCDDETAFSLTMPHTQSTNNYDQHIGGRDGRTDVTTVEINIIASVYIASSSSLTSSDLTVLYQDDSNTDYTQRQYWSSLNKVDPNGVDIQEGSDTNRRYKENGEYLHDTKSYATMNGETKVYTGEWLQSNYYNYASKPTQLGLGTDGFINDDSSNIGSVMKITRRNMFEQPTKVTILGSNNDDFDNESNGATVITENYELINEFLMKNFVSEMIDVEWYNDGNAGEDGTAPIYIPMYDNINKTKSNYDFYRIIFQESGNAPNIGIHTVEYVPFIETLAETVPVGAGKVRIDITVVSLGADLKKLRLWVSDGWGPKFGELYADADCSQASMLSNFTQTDSPEAFLKDIEDLDIEEPGDKFTYTISYWYKVNNINIIIEEEERFACNSISTDATAFSLTMPHTKSSTEGKGRHNSGRFGASDINWITFTPPIHYFATRQDLVTAVNMWVNDNTNARLIYAPINEWDVSQITDMSGMFSNKPTFNEDISNWDVSNVTTMSSMFTSTHIADGGPSISQFNQNLSTWDVGNVENMNYMFYHAQNYEGIGLEAWDTKNVTTMQGMFGGNSQGYDSEGIVQDGSVLGLTKEFNGDITGWDTSKVTNMYAMLYATKFDRDISNWDISSIGLEGDKTMQQMFRKGNLSKENYSAMLISWSNASNIPVGIVFGAGENAHYTGDAAAARRFLIDTKNWTIIDAGLIFQDRDELKTAVNMWIDNNTNARLIYAPINEWDVSAITDMDRLFENTTFNEDISGWDTSSVTTMRNMFSLNPVFNQDIGGWDVSSVTDMTAMLSQWDEFGIYGPKGNIGTGSFNQNLNNWDVSNVKNMSGIFMGQESFTNGTESSLTWDTASAIIMMNMFRHCGAFNCELPNWNTASCHNITGIFWMATDFNQDIGGWDVSNVTHMGGAFYRAISFNQDIGGWDTSQVVEMGSLFRSNSGEEPAFNQDIGGWDTSQVLNMERMFINNVTFNCDISAWDVSSVETMKEMFYGATAFNQDLSDWRLDALDHEDENNEANSKFSAKDMFVSSGLSVSNYTNMLIKWADNEIIAQDVVFDAGTIKYGDGGVDAKATLENKGWVINDGGLIFQDRDELKTAVDSWLSDSVSASLRYGPINEWDTSLVTDMDTLFENTTFNEDISGWDTSSVTTMRNMFKNNFDFNQDISDWDVSSVKNMSGLFTYTTFNQDIGGWNTSSVTTMANMFSSNPVFNQNIGDWDVSRVIDMQTMFSQWDQSGTLGSKGQIREGVFNQNLNGWDVSSVRNLGGMFMGQKSFTNGSESSLTWDTSSATITMDMFRFAEKFTCDLDWDTSNVKNMKFMFYGAHGFNGDISGWDVSNVTEMNGMFHQASAFNGDIGGWETEKVVNMNHMFSQASAFNGDIGGWDVSNVTNMSDMFERASAFNGDISGWNTGNVVNMNSMFYMAPVFNRDIGAWNTGNVVNMSSMFYMASAFNGDISGWNTGNVVNMSSMFYMAPVFNRDIGAWNTGSVVNMNSMFFNHGTDLPVAQFNQDIGGWDTKKVEIMAWMFAGHETFNQDISDWDVSKVTNMGHMFATTSAFNQDISAWDVSNVESMLRMFFGASAFNQNLSDWRLNSLDHDDDKLSAKEMFDGSDLSVSNYTNILEGWAGNDIIAQDVVFGTGTIQWSGSAVSARAILVNKGWIITDGGSVPHTIDH